MLTAAGGGARRLRRLSEAARTGLTRARRAPRTAALAGILAAAAGFTFFGRSASAPHYITAPAERGAIATAVEATGSVEPVGTVDISSQLSGQISRVFAGFNDRVKAGEPIAELDRSIFQAQVDEAQAAVAVASAQVQVHQAALDRARLAVARARAERKMAQDQAAGAQAHLTETEQELQRKQELTRSGSVSARDIGRAQAARDTAAADMRAALDQVAIKEQNIAIADAEIQMAAADLANAEAVVVQRQAALGRARLDLDRTVLRSPIDGVVVKRDVSPGQTVAVALEAKTLFTIASDLRRVEVHGKIDEADIGRVSLGQKVRFTVDAYPNRTFDGTVLQLRKAPESKDGVVTYTAIISAENPDLHLLPGMTATLHIAAKETADILKIPLAALRFRPAGAPPPPDEPSASRGGRGVVWVQGRDGRPAPIKVTLGLSDDSSAEIRSGRLAAGQRVIVGVARRQSDAGSSRVRLGF